MPTQHRGIEVGYLYHILNRGALKQQLFYTDADYDAFEKVILEAYERTPLPILTYQLMPNHWHFVVEPIEHDDDVSNFFQYLSGTHAKRFRAFRDSVGLGHVYQDRFKSFPVQSDDHFLTLCRYVERNARRAGLVSRAELWKWGGLWQRENSIPRFLVSDWPVPRGSDWLDWVNTPLTQAEIAAVRSSIRRGRPFGDPEWTRRTAAHLELEHTLRDRGRPRRKAVVSG